jgi:hypothetical protein
LSLSQAELEVSRALNCVHNPCVGLPVVCARSPRVGAIVAVLATLAGCWSLVACALLPSRRGATAGPFVCWCTGLRALTCVSLSRRDVAAAVLSTLHPPVAAAPPLGRLPLCTPRLPITIVVLPRSSCSACARGQRGVVSVSWPADRSIVHAPLCLDVLSGRIPPCAHVVQLPFGSDAVADLSFPPMPPCSPVHAGRLPSVEPPRPKILCTQCPSAQCPVTHPNLGPGCSPLSSNFGGYPASGL